MPSKTVLCVGDEDLPLASQKELESFGFSVLAARTGPDAFTTFAAHPVDAVVLDYSRPDIDSRHSSFKQLKPRTPVILLSATRPRTEKMATTVDAFVKKDQNPTALLSTLESFIRLRSHSHPELEKEYVVFADANRRFIDCTDGVCQLLGLPRMDLIGMAIEDVSYSPTEVSGLFAKFVRRGQQDGEYVLKHKSGSPVLMRYQAYVFSDGCVAAVWQPLQGWRNLYSAALVELEPNKLKLRVETAATAIHERIRELAMENQRGTEEWQGLQDALTGLKILSRELPSHNGNEEC